MRCSSTTVCGQAGTTAQAVRLCGGAAPTDKHKGDGGINAAVVHASESSRKTDGLTWDMGRARLGGRRGQSIRVHNAWETLTRESSE